MTGGWQGDQGGGWQPSQDPYQQPQYGPPYDPYGQYQPDPYGGGGYPGYDQGFGAPPPKKSKLPIVLSIIAMVAIVGGVVAIVLLNRKDDPQPAANTGSSSSTAERPQTQTKAPPATSRKPPSSAAKPPTKNGWTTIEAPGVSYQVPADWKKAPVSRDSGLEGVLFDGGAENGNYDCGGSNYFRGFTASKEVQSKSGGTLDVNKTVTDFATAFSQKFYNSPQIDAATPTSTTVSGKKAATTTAKLTIRPTKAECEATQGEVAIVGVAIEQGGKVIGVRMLVVVNDLAGGPADPKPLPDPLAEEILETLSVS